VHSLSSTKKSHGFENIIRVYLKILNVIFLIATLLKKNKRGEHVYFVQLVSFNLVITLYNIIISICCTTLLLFIIDYIVFCVKVVQIIIFFFETPLSDFYYFIKFTLNIIQVYN
jgi:hypothetical protein